MIYVTGDTHGPNRFGYNSVDGYLHRFSDEVFPEQKEMTKDDYVIICGDFGGVWATGSESKEESYGLNWLDSKPFTTLFVPGNHENYDRLFGINDKTFLNSWLFEKIKKSNPEINIDGYPQVNWHGGKVRKLRNGVLMLERGYVFNICDKKIFAFGGARSQDIKDGILNPIDYPDNETFKDVYQQYDEALKMFRVLHTSWWTEEMPSGKEMATGLVNLEANNNEVDFIITHDCAQSTLNMFGLGLYKGNELNEYLEKVRQQTKFKKWFFGHYHDNRAVTPDEIMLYEQIVRIV